jgi:hypothetical protein
LICVFSTYALWSFLLESLFNQLWAVVEKQAIPNLLRLRRQTSLSKEARRFLVSKAKQIGVGCIIAGLIIAVLGSYAVMGGFPGATWEIMGSVVQSTDWGLPFAALGILLVLFGVVIAYFGFREK